jgi:hypothetical protein
MSKLEFVDIFSGTHLTPAEAEQIGREYRLQADRAFEFAEHVARVSAANQSLDEYEATAWE